MRRIPVQTAMMIALVLATVVAGAIVPAAASASVQRTILDQQTTNGRFSVGPDKTEIDVAPGSVTRIQMTLTNFINQKVHIKVHPVDLEPAQDPSQLVTIARQSRFGAGSWLTVEPELRNGEADLQPLEQLRFDVIVRTPPDAPVGTNFGGITVEVQPMAPGRDGGDAIVGFKFQGLSQIYLNVAGPVKRDLKVTHSTIGDSFVIGGRRLVTYEVTLRNDGTVNDHLSGKLVISSLFGNTAKELPVPKDLLILRGSKRTWRFVWDGTPRFGRFTARGDFHSDTRDLKPTFPTVTILPPWWWLLLIVGAMAVPVGKRVYDHFFGWRRYLDDVWDEDDEWDDEWDDIPT